MVKTEINQHEKTANAFTRCAYVLIRQVLDTSQEVNSIP